MHDDDSIGTLVFVIFAIAIPIVVVLCWDVISRWRAERRELRKYDYWSKRSRHKGRSKGRPIL